mmetsp:Transcript_32649/g.83520  ORF Transcript_32649/g.83520 Transcript_32649/m.83520 type:complete len:207 (-) Transcript_32649:78-698(-)
MPHPPPWSVVGEGTPHDDGGVCGVGPSGHPEGLNLDEELPRVQYVHVVDGSGGAGRLEDPGGVPPPKQDQEGARRDEAKVHDGGEAHAHDAGERQPRRRAPGHLQTMELPVLSGVAPEVETVLPHAGSAVIGLGWGRPREGALVRPLPRAIDEREAPEVRELAPPRLFATKQEGRRRVVRGQKGRPEARGWGGGGRGELDPVHGRG